MRIRVILQMVITMKSSDPIGVFDSGLGGLSVVETLQRLMPEETIVFFGDSARNPYGTKSRQTVRDYSFEIVEHFRRQNVKAVVIACNTATSAAAKELRKAFDFDIVGMEPALKPAAQKKTPSTIAVWATALTLREEKFVRLMERFENEHEILRIPCPKLVELVEQDRLQEQETVDAVLKAYLKQSEGADFIVLGCTHFLFYKKRLQQLAPDLCILDGNEGTVRHLHELLEAKGLLNQEEQSFRDASSKQKTEQEDLPECRLTIENSDPSKLDLSWKLLNRLKEENR